MKISWVSALILSLNFYVSLSDFDILIRFSVFFVFAHYFCWIVLFSVIKVMKNIFAKSLRIMTNLITRFSKNVSKTFYSWLITCYGKLLVNLNKPCKTCSPYYFFSLWLHFNMAGVYLKLITMHKQRLSKNSAYWLVS